MIKRNLRHKFWKKHFDMINGDLSSDRWTCITLERLTEGCRHISLWTIYSGRATKPIFIKLRERLTRENNNYTRKIT